MRFLVLQIPPGREMRPARDRVLEAETWRALQEMTPDLLLFQDCISLGSGEPNRSSYHSFVLYHSNSPRWGEIVKLPIPIDRFRGSHLRFEFRHCSSE